MIDVVNSITINRPVREVFAFVTDTSKDPRGIPTCSKRGDLEGPIGMGETYDLRFKAFIGRTQASAQVVGFEPNRVEVMRERWVR